MLAALLMGKKPAALAKQLGVSIYVFRNYVASLRVKFQATSIAHLVFLVKEGKTPSPPAPPPPPPPPPDPAALARERYESGLAFYRKLGVEDPAKRCRRPDCDRGVVKYSVFCRKHDYEMLRGEPCPYEGEA